MRYALFAVAICALAIEPPFKPLTVEMGPEAVVAPGVPWPYLALTSQGNFVLFGHVGWPKGGQYPIHYLSRSFDRGKTWQEWKHSAQQGRGPITEGSSVQLRNGKFLFFDVHAEHKGEQYVGNFWSSSDGMKTVEGPFEYIARVPDADSRSLDDRGIPIDRLYIRRSVIELPSGDLLATVYGQFKGDKFPVEYQGGMRKMRSYLIRSKDGGKNWDFVSTIAAGPVEQEGLCEPTLVRLERGPAKGRLICVMRTGRENPMYQAESDDDGKTWTPPRRLQWTYSNFGRSRDMVGTDPDIVELTDGTLVLAYGHKPDYQDDGNFLTFSLDQGRTWVQETRLSSARTMAYPGIREVAPNEVYVVYTNANGTSYDTVGRTVKIKRK